MHKDVPSTENSTEDKEIANKPEMSYGREQKILAWQEQWIDRKKSNYRRKKD